MQRAAKQLQAVNQEPGCPPVSTKSPSQDLPAASPSFPPGRTDEVGVHTSHPKQQQGVLKNQHFRQVNPPPLTCEELVLTWGWYYSKSHSIDK